MSEHVMSEQYEMYSMVYQRGQKHRYRCTANFSRSTANFYRYTANFYWYIFAEHW